MSTNHVALISQTEQVKLGQLALVSAALQKQVTRDFSPIWEIKATVDVFEKLSDVPLGYWPIIIIDDSKDIPEDADGIHKNKDNGQPFALVRATPDWVLSASHECLEMLADPSGNRTIAGNSVKRRQGRVEYLVEVCDPCQSKRFGYSVNGVLVCDFYTPDYFAPVQASGVRYSFQGAIKRPRQVLDGGYLSWFDPESKHIFQLLVDGRSKNFADLGEKPDSGDNLRSFTDRATAKVRRAALKGKVPAHLLLTAALTTRAGRARESAPAPSRLDESVNASAASLQTQIETLIAH